MAYDALQQLQALVTKTTAFNSTGIDLITQTARRGMFARVIATNYSGSAAGAVWTPAIDASSDNTTYVRIATSETALTCATGAATAELFIPVNTAKRYIRAAVDLSPTTGTPTISYQVDLGLSRPG